MPTAIERIVFFGTPQFAVPTLEALCASDRAPILVVSQPSRARGRGRKAAPPPVAQLALERGLPLLQPERVREPLFLDHLQSVKPDLAVVVAFGQIFRRSLLELPRLGCINLHASLLPAYRGAAPIQAAIAAGEETTGVTTMQMDEGLDTGSVLLQRDLPIGSEETAPELARRLAAVGAQLMVETVGRLEDGTLVATPQDAAGATLAPRLKKEDAHVDWSLPAEVIERRVRAHLPWPGTLTGFRGEPLRIHAVALLEEGTDAPQGTLLGLTEQGLRVACGGGTVLALKRVQRPGRRVVEAADLCNAERPEPNERFSTMEALGSSATS